MKRLIILIFILSIFSISCKQKKKVETKEREIVKKVKVKIAQQTTVKEKIKVYGKLEANSIVKVPFKIPGQIMEQNFKIGDFVEKDVVLAKLETEEITYKYNNLKHLLEANRLKLKIIKKGARKQEKKQAEENVKQLKTAYKNMKKIHERFRRIYESKGISKTKYDNTKTEYEVLKHKLKAANEQLDLIKTGARTEEIAIAESMYKANLYNLKLLEKQISYCTIKAPISGYVREKYFENLDMGDKKLLLCMISDISKLKYKFSLNAEEIKKIDGNTKLMINGKELGKLEYVKKAANPFNNEFEVCFIVDNSDSKFLEGEYVKATLILNDKEVIKIDKKAVFNMPGFEDNYVYIIDENRAKLKKIDIADENESTYYISDSNLIGSKVVIHGQFRLDSDDQVEIVD